MQPVAQTRPVLKQFYPFPSQLISLLGSLSIAIAAPAIGPEMAIAQTRLPACRPPSPQEYLLLVISETGEAQAQVRRILPAEIEATVCQYRNNTVTRVGGFTNLEVANSWARYVQDIAGLPAFVAQPKATVANPPPIQPVGGPLAQQPPPPGTALPPATPPTTQTQGPPVTVPPLQRQPLPGQTQPAGIPPTQRPPTAVQYPVQQNPPPATPTNAIPQRSTPASQPIPLPRQVQPGSPPQPLGTGYAVLVDYLNNPEIADRVKQLLNREVALVSYRQRPYLVVAHTANQNEASTILQTLNNRGYWSMIVDGRRVLLVGPVVSAVNR